MMKGSGVGGCRSSKCAHFTTIQMNWDVHAVDCMFDFGCKMNLKTSGCPGGFAAMGFPGSGMFMVNSKWRVGRQMAILKMTGR